MCSCQDGTDFYGTGLGVDWGPWWASEIAYFCRLLPDHKWLMCGSWFSVIHHAHHLTRFFIGWDIINSWVFIEHQPKKYVSSHVRGSVTFGTWFLIHFVLVWFCFVVNDDVVIFVVNVSSEHLCVMLNSPFQGEWQTHVLQIQVEYVTGGNWPNLHCPYLFCNRSTDEVSGDVMVDGQCHTCCFWGSGSLNNNVHSNCCCCHSNWSLCCGLVFPL